jgi:hypothetical protein
LVGRINIVEMAMFFKEIYRFNETSINIPIIFITELEKNPKIYWGAQKTQNSQSNLEQNEQCWRYHNT